MPLPLTFRKIVVSHLSTDFSSATRIIEENVILFIYFQMEALLSKMTESDILVQNAYVGINASDINFSVNIISN
jgi:phosphate starvation-inducible membrane PsiE